VSPEFAKELIDVRLTQTERLLEWMLEQSETDAEAVSCVLGAVMDAHSTIRGIRGGEALAGEIRRH
jgi:hypothetical protein